MKLPPLHHIWDDVLFILCDCDWCFDGRRQKCLTFAHGPVVTPGCEDFSHSLAADGFTALENVVFATTELHHAADATGRDTESHTGVKHGD